MTVREKAEKPATLCDAKPWSSLIEDDEGNGFIFKNKKGIEST